MKYLVLVVIAISLLSFSACEKDQEKGPIDYKLKESTKEWIVDQWADTIFMNSADESIYFKIGQTCSKPAIVHEEFTGDEIGTRESFLKEFKSDTSLIPGLGVTRVRIVIEIDPKKLTDHLILYFENQSSYMFFSYDFELNQPKNFSYIHYTQNYSSTPVGGQHQSFNNSFIEILDTIMLDTVVVNDVMHFGFRDCSDGWYDETVKDIYYAKGIGLVKYKLHSGAVYSREFI